MARVTHILEYNRSDSAEVVKMLQKHTVVMVNQLVARVV